jgi:hypothetical protein
MNVKLQTLRAPSLSEREASQELMRRGRRRQPWPGSL